MQGVGKNPLSLTLVCCNTVQWGQRWLKLVNIAKQKCYSACNYLLKRGKWSLCCPELFLSPPGCLPDTDGYRFLSKSLFPPYSLPRNLSLKALKKGEEDAVVVTSPAPEILALLRECGRKMERSAAAGCYPSSIFVL